MKNYCLNKNTYKDFVLNYIVLNDNLIINKADGSVNCIPYTKECEVLVLELMKKQVLNSKKFLGLLNKKYEIFLKLFLDSLLIVILFVIAGFNTSFISLISYISIFSGLACLTGYKLVSYQKLRKDIMKHFLFINNEDSLNPIIRNNPKMVEGLDIRLKDIVLAKEGKNFSFTINTIDRMNYRELWEVYDEVEFITSEDKSKGLTKMRIKRNKKRQ